MNSNNKKNYIYWMFAIFGAIALNVALFFLIFRFKEFGGVIGKIMAILKPERQSLICLNPYVTHMSIS